MSVINATGFSLDISVPFAIAIRKSAGGVGPSFKSGRRKPCLYDQGKSDARRQAALRSRVSLAHFAMWTSRLITQRFGRPRSRAASGQSASYRVRTATALQKAAHMDDIAAAAIHQAIDRPNQTVLLSRLIPTTPDWIEQLLLPSPTLPINDGAGATRFPDQARSGCSRWRRALSERTRKHWSRTTRSSADRSFSGATKVP